MRSQPPLRNDCPSRYWPVRAASVEPSAAVIIAYSTFANIFSQLRTGHLQNGLNHEHLRCSHVHDSVRLNEAMQAHLKENPGDGFGLLIDHSLHAKGWGKTCACGIDFDFLAVDPSPARN